MALIAKMTAEKVESWGGVIYPEEGGDPTRGTHRQNVVLRCVSGDSDENKQWAKFTPVGSLELSIDNPDAFGQIEAGAEYYVEIRKVMPSKSRKRETDAQA